jgi:hypothetical protein
MTNQSGISKFGLLLTVGLFGALFYFGSQVANFYYSYFELEGLMQQQAEKAAVFSDQEILNTIFKRVKELQIPIDERDSLKINRLAGKIVIETEYTEVLILEWRDKVYDLWEFDFNPRVEAVI